MSITAVLLSLGMLMSYEPGCTRNPYSCGNPSCVSEASAKKTAEFCQTMSCGGCATPSPDIECYEQFGECVKSGDDCNWKPNPQLAECLEKYKNTSPFDSEGDAMDKILKDSGLKTMPFEEWDKQLKQQSPRPNK